MDIDVAWKPENESWQLTDLLGRSMGRIVEDQPGEFRIYPAGLAIGTMEGIRPGAYRTLDDALAAIERFTRGTCRREKNYDR